MFNSVQRQKQQFDKTKINAWVSMLSDIWKDDVDIIREKLLYIADERFDLTKENRDYIDYEVIKLMKYIN